MRFTKKLLAAALVLTVLVGLMPITALASDITVTINEQDVHFPGQQPINPKLPTVL